MPVYVVELSIHIIVSGGHWLRARGMSSAGGAILAAMQCNFLEQLVSLKPARDVNLSGQKSGTDSFFYPRRCILSEF